MTVLRRCINRLPAAGHRFVHDEVVVQSHEQVSFDSVVTAITPAHGQVASATTCNIDVCGTQR